MKVPRYVSGKNANATRLYYLLFIYKVMKAIQIKNYGSSNVVEVNDTAPVPRISSGKILVSVKSSAYCKDMLVN